MNLDLLERHYKRAENRARSEYLEAGAEAARAVNRGVLSREELTSELEKLEQLEESFYDAQLRHAAIFLRRMSLAPRPLAVVVLRILARLIAAHRPLEAFTHRASNDHAPPLARLAHSISSHGPPRRRDSQQALRLSVLTM